VPGGKRGGKQKVAWKYYLKGKKKEGKGKVIGILYM